jgi:integrase
VLQRQGSRSRRSIQISPRRGFERIPEACGKTIQASGFGRRGRSHTPGPGTNAQEVARLLGAIPGDSTAGLRLRALVFAYLLIARRRSEVLNPRWRDLDLEGGFEERQRALPPPVRAAILAYASVAGLARKPEEAVFPGRWAQTPTTGWSPRADRGPLAADAPLPGGEGQPDAIPARRLS